MSILPEAAWGGNDCAHISGTTVSARTGIGRVLLVLTLALSTAVASFAPGACAAEDAVTAALRQRVGQLRSAGTLDIQGVKLGGEDILAEFYARRAYQPAWADPGRVAELRALVTGAVEHGLDPRDFFATEIAALAAAPASAEARADLDLVLTEALIRYGYQRRFGKVNPVGMEPAWNFRRGFAADADPVALLGEAIEAPSLQDYLDSRLPGGPWYRQLQAALARYRALDAAGGWPNLPDGPVLRPGASDPRVLLLRERLRIEGDLESGLDPADPALFDAALATAVARFQGRHALAGDGTVGARTRAALNVPAGARVNQLRISLERVRWLSGDVPSTYVVVNVAGFQVGFVRDHRLVWNSRVVVGRAARQTPVFMGRMTYIEINPTWTVPPTILREDILPKLGRDPDYLARENISVIDRSGRVVDPRSVNWSAYSRSVPYTLRQEPGPANSLGRIKLMFPNPHSVYLHDTPAKALFDKPERTFSSGCIRVEDPLALAELVLADPRWDRSALEAAIATNRTQRVRLKAPVPVMLVYLTAIADPAGTARFFRDIYDRDPALLSALDGPVRLDIPGPVATKMGPAAL